MNWWESISVALESLYANKMRTVLTMLGVIIGVGAVITMLAIAGGARQRMMSNIQQMGTNVLMIMPGQTRNGAVMRGMGSVQSLTLEDSEAIVDKCPSVARTAPEAGGSAQVKWGNQNTNTSILGTTPEYTIVRNFTLDKGRFFNDREVKSAMRVAVLGATTAENLFGKVTPVGKRIRIKGTSFEVIGVMKEKGTGGFGNPDDQIFVPISTAMRRLFGLQYVRFISAQARTMDQTDRAISEIENLLQKRHRIGPGEDNDFVIRSQAEIMQMADQASGIFTLLLGGIASVSLIVGGIGIMNIMLVSVTERTREIGLRMALGARRRDIQGQFLIEALVLSLMGGAIGTLLGVAAAAVTAKFSGWNVTVSMQSVLLSFGFAAFVGVFFGFYPARKASNLDPIESLRYE